MVCKQISATRFSYFWDCCRQRSESCSCLLSGHQRGRNRAGKRDFLVWMSARHMNYDPDDVCYLYLSFSAIKPYWKYEKNLWKVFKPLWLESGIKIFFWCKDDPLLKKINLSGVSFGKEGDLNLYHVSKREKKQFFSSVWGKTYWTSTGGGKART